MKPSDVAFKFADNWASFTCMHECALELDKLLQETRKEVLDLICLKLSESDRAKALKIFKEQFGD